MNATLSRYRREQSRTDLAIRMIGHEVRTYLIRRCTGLSEDRIRKLYNVYFRQDGCPVTRHRGKTPRQPEYFTRNLTAQLEATTFIRVSLAAGIIRFNDQQRATLALPAASATYGQRFCDAYEAYAVLHNPPGMSFERAWNLVDALCRGHVVGMSNCRRCEVSFLRDTLDANDVVCPACCLGPRQ